MSVFKDVDFFSSVDVGTACMPPNITTLTTDLVFISGGANGTVFSIHGLGGTGNENELMRIKAQGFPVCLSQQ